MDLNYPDYGPEYYDSFRSRTGGLNEFAVSCRICGTLCFALSDGGARLIQDFGCDSCKQKRDAFWSKQLSFLDALDVEEL